MFNKYEKKDTVSFGTALTWTLVFSLQKSSPHPEIKVYLESRFNLLRVLMIFNRLRKNLFLSVLLLIL